MNRKSIKRLATELDSLFANGELTEKLFLVKYSDQYQGDSLSQPWLNRLRRGEFKSITPKIRKVMECAGVSLYAHKDDKRAGRELIDAAVMDTWNGDFDSADAIASVIRACKTFSD